MNINYATWRKERAKQLTEFHRRLPPPEPKEQLTFDEMTREVEFEPIRIAYEGLFETWARKSTVVTEERDLYFLTAAHHLTAVILPAELAAVRKLDEFIAKIVEDKQFLSRQCPRCVALNPVLTRATKLIYGNTRVFRLIYCFNCFNVQEVGKSYDTSRLVF